MIYEHQKITKKTKKTPKIHFFTKILLIENAKNDHFSISRIEMTFEIEIQYTLEKREKGSKKVKKSPFFQIYI